MAGGHVRAVIVGSWLLNLVPLTQLGHYSDESRASHSLTQLGHYLEG
ncbi:hypothetical protein [Sporosarcina ureilytica]|nr:hypothetical protein [Sporosarcina ureilytica]